MSERCGAETETTDGPCQLPAGSCPHHDGASGLSDQKEKAREMLASGDYKRTEVAKACGVTARTLRRWRQKHPELEEAAKEGDRAQYVEVVDAWIERLKAGEHSASEIIFYLKNKSRILPGEDWRDTQEVEHSGEIGTGGEKPMTDDQRADKIRELLADVRAKAQHSENGNNP